MSSRRRTLAAVGGFVLLATVVSVGVLLWGGSQLGVWFVLVGAPTILIVGVGIYVRGVVARGGTNEQNYVRKRARDVADQLQEVQRTLQERGDRYPDWEPTALETRIENVAADLKEEGVDYDVASTSYSFGRGADRADLQEIERLGTEIEGVRSDVDGEFERFLRTELSRLDDQMERLETADLVGLARTERVPDDASIETLERALDERRDGVTELIRTAADRVRETSRNSNEPDVQDVDASLERAVDAVEEESFAAAVDAVLEARDGLKRQLSGSFDDERDALLDLVDAVEASDVDEHVDATYLDDVAAIREEVSNLDSALALEELGRYRTRLRRTCVDVVAALETELGGHVETLRDADLPTGYYSEPAVAEESFVDDLEDASTLESFTDQWTAAVERLTGAIKPARRKAAVVDAYDDVAETIEERLRSNGEVTGDDLPVRHASEFLGLYYRRNPNVEFDERRPALRLGDVERHDLEVDVTYERGGPVRTATIELVANGSTRSRTVETRVADSVVFDDVPAGTHTVEATPGDDDFRPVTREVEVSGGTSVSVEFLERGLRERVCEDIDDDMSEYLPEVAPRLTERFEEVSYVSTSMDLPVRDSHAPCLLAIWAEENGYDAVLDDGDVVVYERDQLRRELENVVDYNLDPGESLSFDEARRNFLSVAVSDSVIRDVVSELEHDATTTDTEIRLE